MWVVYRRGVSEPHRPVEGEARGPEGRGPIKGKGLSSDTPRYTGTLIPGRPSFELLGTQGLGRDRDRKVDTGWKHREGAPVRSGK